MIVTVPQKPMTLTIAMTTNKKLGNDFEAELWLPIKDYENLYSVSNFGRVMSHHWGKEKLIRSRKNTKGYMKVNLCKNGKMKTFNVHRLVAETFLPNPNRLTEINHIDENKSNNRLDNLEWCTRSYNVNYGSRIAKYREKIVKGVVQFSKDGNEIATFNSITDAAKSTKMSGSMISACCKKKLPAAKGYVWRYSTEVLNGN